MIERSSFESGFFAPAMRGGIVGFQNSFFHRGAVLVGASAYNLSIRKAEVDGDVQLTDASTRTLRVEQTRVSGDVVLGGLEGSTITLQGLRTMAVQALKSRSEFFAIEDVEAHDLSLLEATVGSVAVQNSKFTGTIHAYNISGSSFGLGDSRVESDVSLKGASFKRLLTVSGTAIKGTLDLVGASSDGNIEVGDETGKRVGAGALYAVGIRTGGNMVLRSLDVGGDLWINGQSESVRVSDVKVIGRVNMASFAARQNVMLIGGVQAGGDVSLSDVVTRDVSLRDVTSAGALALYRVKAAGYTTFDRVRAPRLTIERLATTDLSLGGLAVEGLAVQNTSVERKGDLRISGAQSSGLGGVQGVGLRSLSLQDASFGTLDLSVSDDTEITLEDVRWKAISLPCPGVARAASGRPNPAGDARCLRYLLDRNTSDGAQPYVQAATVYADAGHTALADEFRFRGRQRQSASLSERAVEAVVGYGIGVYAYRVFAWILGLSALAAVVLYGTVPAARVKGPLWCFGAGLNQLLPVVTLNKEFGDFFNDSERQRLRGWQIAFFAVLALIGWALGLFVVAAMAGLTQKV